MTKNKVLEMLKAYQKEETNCTNAKNIKVVMGLVKASKREEYKGASINMNAKKHLNLGCLVERLVLDYFGLEAEDNDHEIKALINNTPNVLDNENVKVCYVALVSESVSNGLYRVEASEIRGKRLGKKEMIKLIKNKKAKKVCALSTMVKA